MKGTDGLRPIYGTVLTFQRCTDVRQTGIRARHCIPALCVKIKDSEYARDRPRRESLPPVRPEARRACRAYPQELVHRVRPGI
jgi:hypothetical protein